ncbi:MAG: hypothetical protein ABI647_12980 [Gemmatimonadota bacterium]
MQITLPQHCIERVDSLGNKTKLCATPFDVSDRFKDLDFLAMLGDVSSAVTKSGETIAFSGIAQQELVLTTKRRDLPQRSGYYQVSFRGTRCSSPPATSDLCRVYGSAALILFSGGPMRDTLDAMSSGIESILRNRVVEAAYRSKGLPPPKD